jgi:hypothetical protein
MLVFVTIFLLWTLSIVCFLGHTNIKTLKKLPSFEEITSLSSGKMDSVEVDRPSYSIFLDLVIFNGLRF